MKLEYEQVTGVLVIFTVTKNLANIIINKNSQILNYCSVDTG